MSAGRTNAVGSGGGGTVTGSVTGVLSATYLDETGPIVLNSPTSFNVLVNSLVILKYNEAMWSYLEITGGASVVFEDHYKEGIIYVTGDFSASI